MLKRNSNILNLLQRFSDLFAVGLAWSIAYTIRFEYITTAQTGLKEYFFQLGAILILASSIFFHRHGLYRSQRFNSKLNEIYAVLKANTFVFLTLIITLYFLAPERVSRIHLLLYFAISSLLVALNRILVRNFLRLIRKRGFNLRHVILLGSNRQLIDYVHATKRFKDCGIKIKGWIDSDGLANKMNINDFGHWSSERIDEFEIMNIDAFVAGYKSKDSEKREIFLKDNYNRLVPIKIIPDLSFSYIGHQVEDFAGIPLLNVNQPSFSGVDLFLKRFFDISLSLLGLILISPLLFVIAVMVKLSSPGPIFYGQKRMGLDGKIFLMWKFRSMKVASSDKDTKEWSNKDNPRKTKFGSFIRKTSLDELPQLWNVLMGNMSLVGPRPEQPFFIEKFKHEIPAYMLRHKMKAGITGWAQINGWRGDTCLKSRIQCDIYYIKNWSIWLDIKILFLTFVKGFINSNAY